MLDMSLIRRLILAVALASGIAPAFAQAPPPIPALPDTERRTSYAITGTTCSCSVNMSLYGDSTDYQNWLEVYLNGALINYNDPTFGWSIASPTGPLATISRPITDAVLTFNVPQTGTVQIVGARRPRRTSQFNENAGVSARNLNQVFTDVISQNREIWDKVNDFTGRALVSQPGVTLGLLPIPSACISGFLGFDSTGLIPVCRSSSGPGNVQLPVVSGDLVCFHGTAGQLLDCGLPPLFPSTPFAQDFIAGTNFTAGTTNSLTLSSTPASPLLLTITFDGIGQNANTWSLSGAVVSFNAAIPLNTQVVEAKWSQAATVGGVTSLTANGISVSGAVNLVGGATTSVTASGQNITVGNNTSTVSIMDSAYGAKCNATIYAGGNLSINSGSAALTFSGGAFTPADVTTPAKSIWVPGAGVAGAGLSTTITGYTSPTQVTLGATAGTTLAGVAATQANPLVYGTDDTAAINAAITATPPFGTLIINPISLPFPVRGCLIKQTGATGTALTVNHPINILGGGNSSALITDPSMGNTTIDIHALVSGVTWKGITWQGFLLGTDTNFTNMPRWGSYGIWFDATSAGPGGFTGLTIQNISIGENGNGFYSLVLDGIGTQGNRIDNNFIIGGISLAATADSNQITRNRLLGVSTFGISINTPTAGNFLFSGNSTTLAAGVCIQNGSSITVSNNFFEEQTASGQYAHNAQLDLGCSSGQAMSSISVYGNIITAGLTNANNIKIDANTGYTYLSQNETATRVSTTASITNGNATTYCGPNQIITASPHLTGTAPILWGVGAC